MRVYRARWVLPITASPIPNGAVGVGADGRITYVGSADLAPAGVATELGDAILLPGLVNTHTHLELTTMRGFLEDLSFFDWIVRLTTARREVLDRADLLDAARLGIEEGVHAGITTYADTCQSGVVMSALLDAGVRGIMYQEVFGPDPAEVGPALRDLREKVAELRAMETDLVRVGVSPHAPYSVSDALFASVAAYARADALPVAIHVAESEAEQQYVRDAEGTWAQSHRRRGIAVTPRGRSPVDMLARNDVLSARPLLIHGIRMDAADLDLARTHDCAIAHCPASNAKLGHGIAPLTEMLATGLRVGLGSDSVASNNRMDLLEEARLALLLQRARHLRSDGPSATEALELATLGGARALGIDDRVGSLEEGKDADLCAFPLDARSSPSIDPAATLVFSLSGRAASFACVKGEPLLVDGVLTRGDAALRGRVEAAGDRLAEWARARR